MAMLRQLSRKGMRKDSSKVTCLIHISYQPGLLIVFTLSIETSLIESSGLSKMDLDKFEKIYIGVYFNNLFFLELALDIFQHL